MKWRDAAGASEQSGASRGLRGLGRDVGKKTFRRRWLLKALGGPEAGLIFDAHTSALDAREGYRKASRGGFYQGWQTCPGTARPTSAGDEIESLDVPPFLRYSRWATELDTTPPGAKVVSSTGMPS